MEKRPILHETHHGYKIYHRPWIVRRPWRAQVPDRPTRCADVATLDAARAFIDRRLEHMRRHK
jgi:hypothetical protein